MKQYLEDGKFFAVNEDKTMWYKVSTADIFLRNGSIHWNLELVCGMDYINPDMSDVQGMVSADRFIEDVQFMTAIQYVMKEGAEEAFEAEEMTIVKWEDAPEAVRKFADEYDEKKYSSINYSTN